MRYPGLFVGKRVDEVRRGPFLAKKIAILVAEPEMGFNMNSIHLRESKKKMQSWSEQTKMV